LAQGKGTRPTRIDLTNGVATDMGIDAPATAPSVVGSGTPKKYVARIDVVEGGNLYSAAPPVTLSSAGQTKPAKARAYLSGSQVGDISVLDHGSGYTSTPTVTLGATFATGAELTATLAGSEQNGSVPVDGGDPTALGKWDVVSNPVPYLCLPGIVTTSPTPLLFHPSTGTRLYYSQEPDVSGNRWTLVGREGNTIVFHVEVAGGTTTAGIRLTFGTRVVEGAINAAASVMYPTGAPLKIEVQNYTSTLVFGITFNPPYLYYRGGSGYTKNEAYEIQQPGLSGAGACGGSSPLVISFYSNESDNNSSEQAAAAFPIDKVTLVNGGTGFVVPPDIEVDDTYGSGAELKAEITNGVVTGVTVVKGGLYTKAPTLRINSGGAQAIAITRAHIRGTYDCFYRYVDDTPAERGGPICSSLSPVTTLDTGDGVEKLTWSVPAPPVVLGRKLTTELWRTTSDQAYTVYRVASGVTSYVDTLSDPELTDYERSGYAAMAVLLPNGELNANRFGVPPSDKSVAVMFQDRLWMACDSSGDGPNTLRFSEANEPESCPDVNELILQTNVKGHDHITALIPYGASLGVMQTSHSYRLSFVSQPIIDANPQLVAYRGCLNQRCWDEFEGLVYCMDAQGVYAMDLGGQVQPLSLGIRDLFDSKIDFSKSDWFSVTADRKARCLRVSVRFIGEDQGKYPSRMFCYSFDSQGWWEERYPAPLVGSATVRDFNGVSRCVYGSEDGRLFEVNSGNTDTAFGTVTKITATNLGSGYLKTPLVKITGDGVGAAAEAAIGTDGRLLGVYLRCGGYGYTSAQVVIDPPPTGGTAPVATATCGDVPTASIPCWYKSGNLEYPHDSLPVEMQDKNRNVGLLFTPTSGPCKMKLRMYYNNSPFPRINVAARDRGTGVVYETQEPCVTLDMDANLLPDRISSGVCRALFSSHTVDDIQGNDRHVAFELSADRDEAGRVEIHSVDVFGTPGAR
jgi:hypothetical protein